MADRLVAELAAIRAEMTVSGPRFSDAQRLLATLDAVLEIHRPQQRPFPDEDPGAPWCAGCAIDSSDEGEEPFSSGAWRSWPCPTYLAICRALLGEEASDGE